MEKTALDIWVEFGHSPNECCDCPYGTPMYLEDYHNAPNPSDPGEGYYECSLLGLKDVWGENPKCEDEEFKKLAISELKDLRDKLGMKSIED